MLQLFSEFIACLLAIITFRRLANFSKLIAIQIIIVFIVEVIGWQMKLHNHKNIWLYNCYMPVEFSLLFIVTWLKYKPAVIYCMITFLAFYWLCWIVEISTNSIDNFALKTYVFGAIILLISYSLVLYKSVQNRNSLFSQSKFWLAIGIILFFGCNIPFFSMHHYIANYSNPAQINMLVNLMSLFAHIRYLCMAIGFVMAFYEFKNKKI